MKKQPNVLTTGEAAKYCDVNFRTVIRWIEKGYLNAYKLPGRGDKRIPRESLVRFLKQHDMPIHADLIETNNRVLIVEDEPKMADAIARLLKRAGLQTKIATSGFEAGELLRSYQPAVMTLDIGMPGLSGIDVLKYTKAQQDFAELKIIIVSAQHQSELEECLRLGADLAINKPFENSELIESVSRLIKHSETPEID
ncbi:MAG: response regulator [Kangiellaceae bacterium]|nr:response regulator [Kangiellaceae bacterium]